MLVRVRQRRQQLLKVERPTCSAGAVAAHKMLSTALPGCISSQGAKALARGATRGCAAFPATSAPVSQSLASFVSTSPGCTATATSFLLPELLQRHQMGTLDHAMALAVPHRKYSTSACVERELDIPVGNLYMTGNLPVEMSLELLGSK